MFVNESLKTHLETSSTVSLQSLILAEWNLNMPDNIFKLGNYRYRPLGTETKFKTIPNTFDQFDIGYTTVETVSKGSTTLLASSNREFVFTGTNIHETKYKVLLPVTTTLSVGNMFTLHNKSAQAISIKTSSGEDIFDMPPETSAQFILILADGTTYASWKSFFVSTDNVLGINGYYTNATDADVFVDGGYTNTGVPQIFRSKKEKVAMLYSLEDCIKPFRPRSGINKLMFFDKKYIANSGAELAERPRYYMPSRYDLFRYWTSYRTESGFEQGIANIKSNDQFYINDAAPFVVYKENVPANRIVVKMQTNSSNTNLGPFTTATGTINDPLYGTANKTTPIKWKIQYLKNNTWVDAASFDQTSLRSNGQPIIGYDGHVQLQYGLIVPKQYKDSFIFAETLASKSLLPSEAPIGYSYLVIGTATDVGTFYIYTGTGSDGGYESFPAKYGWSVTEDEITQESTFIKDLTAPASFVNASDGTKSYREIEYLRGLRIVVETMNKFDSTFDLIEMSPRLVADISDKTINFKITKQLSDIGNTSLPVGQLLASTGSIELFDEDQAFNENNTTSIISKYTMKNVKFNFYEKILNVSGYDYFVPIKTMYTEGLPQADNDAGTISVDLRDMFFFLESMSAPRMLTTQTSLSYAVSMLLDYIGFSNYTFKRVAGEADPIIPYFFIGPDQNVAEVLNKLAVATQSAMFFDEYNNFIVMSKDYMMPSATQRATSMVLSGSNNQTDNGIVENLRTGTLPNIMSLSSQNRRIFNDGKINYTTRYIQRSYGSIRQASLVDQEKTWIYKPSLLWEVSGTDSTKTINEVASKQGSYVLGAMPLNSTLKAEAPTVVKNELINNTIDLGENIYWLTRYQGYLYSNGEIIKYDAAQFNITASIWYPVKTDGSLDYTKPQIVQPGALAPAEYIAALDAQVAKKEIKETDRNNKILSWRSSNKQGSNNVWITNNQEYQKYFSILPFNGKIYPTGLVRIEATPFYETVDGKTKMKNGNVQSHGRAQFGTTITSHTAGIDDYWANNDYVRGCSMDSSILFRTTEDTVSPTLTLVDGKAGISNTIAKQTTRNGVIKNFMATNYQTETEVNALKSTQAGTIQSSALVMNGPSFKTTEVPLDFVSYTYKALDNSYKHFGTRMRVIGKIENNNTRVQTPIGSSPYYQVTGSLASQNISIGGGSGGLAVLLNPENNNGYYFEVVALTESNIEGYSTGDLISNLVFYKIKKKSGTTDTDKAIPVKLWGGLANISVDDGRFTGQYRLNGEDNPTVYDLSVEYQTVGKTRKFFLYVNGKLVQIVVDSDPLPIYNNMALFVRGSSRVMFENIYALAENYAQNTVATVSPAIQSIFGQTDNTNSFNRETGLFGDNAINLNESFRKYAMSGVVQATYLSGISSQQPPKYNMYFEEFGSIMRECAYFDIRYDRAFPALYSQLSPTFNRIKGYTVSGFQADSYGAEFMIFNATDKALVLDETSGNYLRIQGITFTQDTTHELTVDEYFSKRSNFSNPELSGTTVVTSPTVELEKYNIIKNSRLNYGKSDFTIESEYIQTDDAAQELMGWFVNKMMTPKKSIGIELFSIPTLQLGDIVTINYKDSNGLDLVVPTASRFVVYNIEYTRNQEGPNMTVYLSEV